jgi:sarcosine oxidase subunit alpha
MNNGRIEHHPVLGLQEKRKPISFNFNGVTYQGLEEDTVASALLANGIRTLRYQEEKGTPRGIYCNIGHCFECRITVNDTEGVRACLTLVQEGMEIKSGRILPTPLKRGAQ